MKYFMSVHSPSHQGRRVFLMNEESAKHYYNDYLRKYGHDHKLMCFTNGVRIESPHNNIHIWGENISDRELFKRRLNGSLDKETLES